MKWTSVGGAVIAAACVSFAIPGHAALVSCTGTFTTDGTAKVHDGANNAALNLTAASSCQYISPPDNNNVANETNVNVAGFFGFSDWDLFPSADQVDVEAGTGDWSLAGANFALNDYMIVFKDGKDTNLIGFLFNELFTSGGWDTPFTEPPFVFTNGNSTSHDVSHYSIFSRTADTPPPPPPGQVPEPGSLVLLGLGLAGLTLVRRRRRA